MVEDQSSFQMPRVDTTLPLEAAFSNVVDIFNFGISMALLDEKWGNPKARHKIVDSLLDWWEAMVLSGFGLVAALGKNLPEADALVMEEYIESVRKDMKSMRTKNRLELSSTFNIEGPDQLVESINAIKDVFVGMIDQVSIETTSQEESVDQ